MAARMKVIYLDGTEVDVVATPRAQVETERYLKSGYTEATMVEAGYRLAYESSKPGIGNVGYEEWLDKIADVEELETKPVDPTPETPSSTPSSD